MKPLETYINFKLQLLADIVDENLGLAEEYLTKVFKDNLSKFREFNEDNFTFNIKENGSLTFDVNLRTNNIELLITCNITSLNQSISFDEFYDKIYPAFTRYIKYLENTINELLSCDDIFGFLPNAEITIINDNIYVRLGYHQTSLELESEPATVELSLDEDIYSIIEDLYYDFTS